jgi:hypothetical protein
MDQEFRTIQSIQTTMPSDITCLSLRANDGTVFIYALNIYLEFRSLFLA